MEHVACACISYPWKQGRKALRKFIVGGKEYMMSVRQRLIFIPFPKWITNHIWKGYVVIKLIIYVLFQTTEPWKMNGLTIFFLSISGCSWICAKIMSQYIFTEETLNFLSTLSQQFKVELWCNPPPHPHFHLLSLCLCLFLRNL